MMMNRISGNTVLTNDQLKMTAPSVFATKPWDKMSDKYRFIPTIDAVEALRANGFEVFSARQSRTRIEGKGEFTKHQLRLRDVRNGNLPATLKLGQLYPEVIVTNAHDGGSAYKLDAGLYRLVCTNGMMVAQGTVPGVSVRHSGQIDNIIDAAFEVIDEFPKMLAEVEEFGALSLNPEQQMVFANSALTLRYEEGQSPVKAADLLTNRRADDRERSLWNTLNIVQENMIKGGLRGRGKTGRRFTTRSVKSIAEDTRLNRSLWTLAQEMAKLVK
jgi:hypothetical protein